MSSRVHEHWEAVGGDDRILAFQGLHYAVVDTELGILGEIVDWRCGKIMKRTNDRRLLPQDFRNRLATGDFVRGDAFVLPDRVTESG